MARYVEPFKSGVRKILCIRIARTKYLLFAGLLLEYDLIQLCTR